MKFDEVLRRFSAFFEQEGIRYALAMKVHAMKQRPMRVLIDAPDIAFLLALPGVDRDRVRDYFSQQGLLKIYDELEKERG